MTKIDEAAKEVKPSKYDRPENWKPPAAKPAKNAGADDELDDVIKPKRGPPKGLGVRPKKKVEAAAADDMPMADEEEVMAAPAKRPAAVKPPPNIGKKPEPRKPAAAPTKAPTAPVIQEEDLGAGLSKE
jgi:hypothetical protein